MNFSGNRDQEVMKQSVSEAGQRQLIIDSVTHDDDIQFNIVISMKRSMQFYSYRSMAYASKFSIALWMEQY